MRIPFISAILDRRAADANRRAAENAIADFLRERAFDAQRVMRELADWQWDGGFDNTSVLDALPTIRSRSRDMAKNSPLYARFIQLMRENVVGSGFRFKSMPFRVGEDPGKLDAEAAHTLEYHWWRWTSNPYFVDVARRMNLTQLLALAVEAWTRDGEAFVVIDRRAQNPYGVALRLLRSDCIDVTVNFDIDERRTVRGGIEYDRASGAPTAYYFNGSAADTAASVFYGGRERIRIDARDVIHLYERHDAGQLRGVPLGYAALVPLKMLDEYTKAELTAARAEACTVSVFHSPLPSGSPGGGSPSDEQRGKVSRMIRNGQELWLPAGWEFDSHTPNHPNRAWADYAVSLQRLISTGLGVDFAELTGNGTGTISAVARQAMIRTREMFRARQEVVVSLFLDRLWYSWLRSFLSLSVSGDLMPEDFDRLSDHEFQGRRWGWIDPTAEVNAAAVAVAHGWRSDAEVAAEYGNDVDDMIAEAARIKDAKEAAGLITIGNGLGSAPKSPAPTSDDSDEPQTPNQTNSNEE